MGGFVTIDTFEAQGPSGRQLARAEATVAQSGITSATDLTGLVIEFTVGSRPVDVILELAALSQTTVGGVANAIIADQGNAAKENRGYYCAVANESRPIRVVEHITVPGSYVRKGRASRVVAGTVGNGVGSDLYTSFIQAIER